MNGIARIMTPGIMNCPCSSEPQSLVVTEHYFVCVSLKQVDYLVYTFMNYYNSSRPHQGEEIGNQTLNADFRSSSQGTIKSEAKLGGLLRHYYGDAA